MKDTITLPRSVVEQTLAAMQSFVSKCDTGLARSKNSYWDFKAVLPDLQAAFDAPVEAPTPQNLELHIAQLKATSIILRNSNEPVTFSAKKIAIADAIDALLFAVAAPAAEPLKSYGMQSIHDAITEDPMLACDIAPRPLWYPLSHYHLAIGGGPLHFTWKDKPHRLVYDLIAAVKHYAQRVAPTAEPQPDKGCMNRLHGESEGDLHIAYIAGYGKGRQDGAKESQRVPLTEGQIFDLAGNYDCGMLEKNDLWVFTSPKQLLTFVRAIEAASIKEGS